MSEPWMEAGLESSVVSAQSPQELHSRLDHGPNVTVLENEDFAVPCWLHGDFHHRPRQVVGANHLVGEQHPKRGVDRAQEAVAEIRFLPRLDGINIGGPEDINAGKTGCEKRLFRLAFVARERNPTPPRWVRATPA